MKSVKELSVWQWLRILGKVVWNKHFPIPFLVAGMAGLMFFGMYLINETYAKKVTAERLLKLDVELKKQR